MTSEGLGEMFEGDSADTCAGKFPLVSMEGRAEGLACADPGARTPISASGNRIHIVHSHIKSTHFRKNLTRLKKMRHKIFYSGLHNLFKLLYLFSLLLLSTNILICLSISMLEKVK